MQILQPPRETLKLMTHLVDEDDGGLVLLGQPEHIAHHAGALAQVLLHKLGADDPDEGGGGVVRDSLGQHRLACGQQGWQLCTGSWPQVCRLVQKRSGWGKADQVLPAWVAAARGCSRGLLAAWDHSGGAQGMAGCDDLDVKAYGDVALCW